MAFRSIAQLLLFVLTLVTFGGTLYVNYLIGKGGSYLGLNFTSISNVSGMFETSITPSGWAFAIWGLIYLWQITLLVYTGVLFCCKAKKNPYEVDGDPDLNLILFYPAHIASSISNAVWVVIWCQEYAQYAAIPIAVTPIALWAAECVVISSLVTSLNKCSCRRDVTNIILMIVLVQNGIGIYATWTTIAALINSVVAVTYFADVSMTTASTAALSVLSCLLTFWFVIDNFTKYEKACRYFFMPYLVVIYALIAVIDKNWVPGDAVSIFTAVLLGVTSVYLLVKIPLVVWRSKQRPLFAKQPPMIKYYENDKENLVIGHQK